MRTKLTVSHPRPSSTERAPIRPGAPRRPRPPQPDAPSAPRSAKPAGSGRPATERPAYAGKRPDGDRPAYAGRRPDGDRPAYAGKRPDGDRPAYAGRRPNGDRPSYAGKRPDGDRPAYAGRRPDGDRPAYAGKRPDGDRPSYAGKRPDGDRPAYAGKRPDGDRPAYAGKRPDGDRPAYAGKRPDGDRPAYAGKRPDGDRPAYAGKRPDGDRPAYAGRRPDGDRPAYAGKRPDGDRPAYTGKRPDGDRPAYAGKRPDGDRPGYAGKRPAYKGGQRAEGERAPYTPRNTPKRDQEGGSGSTRPTYRAEAPAAQVEREEDGTLRLSKRMSELGLCSRREADDWIEKGWVRVDGERVDTLGTRVRPEQKVEVIRQAREQQNRLVTILLHKPVGHVSGQPEDGHPPAAALILPDNRWIHDASRHRFEHVHLRALAPAGRLDIDSTGLLVFTQDGRVAKQLIGENSEVEKEYLVRVSFGKRTEDIESHFPASKLALLRHGLSLDDTPLQPAQVDWQNGEQLRFILREGKKRQIRRMCEAVGLEVVALKRVRIGQIMLGSLPVGEWRYLADNEVF